MRRGDVVIATDKEDMLQKVMDLTGVQRQADTARCAYQRV